MEHPKLMCDPKLREELKQDMAKIIQIHDDALDDQSDYLAEKIISELEKLGWHGVKE